MRLRTSAAISTAALVAWSCGGAPPPAGPNGGCSGVWRDGQCVQEVLVAAPTATTAPPPLPPSRPTATPAPSTPASPSAPAIARARDPRTSRLRPRSIPLLVTEIQQLEALASATPDTQPDKVAMLRRLAEDYVELERAANAAGRAQVESSAQKGALKNYDALVAGFASYPLLDEARYFDALEHEAAGDLGAAKRLYYELVSKNPTSRYVPYAYFAFGEMFVSEGADDPSKLDLALQSFQKAVEAPPPDNKLYGWAWFRIGNVEDQKGDASAAHDAYAKAREFATAYPQIPGSNDLLAALPP